MDVLADVLSATRIGGTIFTKTMLLAPWGVQFDPASKAGFHIVLQGSAWLRVSGTDEPVALHQGDVVLLPHGAGHSLASDLRVEPTTVDEMLATNCARLPAAAADVALSAATLMCGAYQFERDAVHPLLALLPPVIHVLAEGGHVAGPLQSVMRLLVDEYDHGGPGSTAVVTRLIDVLFIYIIRCWADAQREGTAGWLGALRDPQIGRALAAIHRQPERDWSLEALAGEVGMSRSSFVRRFGRLVGEPPLGYLTRWRMDVAARLLRETDRPMAQIADRVGYRSEYAFNRAFQRTRGVPPGRYRERSRVEAA
ncbi:AraC family transcriptional regulator [Haliangium sp.]|uniref:AraC family transcriptional regulator n=1 Tax=Haliangium sp. TaxID=2663208 RepID=UPI003D10942A